MANKPQKTLKKFDKLDDNAPVLPSLRSMMDVELVVNPNGGAMVIITQELQESYWWAEYDVDLQQLYFVTVKGKVQGLGMKIHDAFEENLSEGEDVRIAKYNKKTKMLAEEPYIVPLVVRKHTLEDLAHG